MTHQMRAGIGLLGLSRYNRLCDDVYVNVNLESVSA